MIEYIKLWKYSGILLSATGIIHIIVAITQEWNIYKELFFDGLINSISNNTQKALSFWFFYNWSYSYYVWAIFTLLYKEREIASTIILRVCVINFLYFRMFYCTHIWFLAFYSTSINNHICKKET